MWANGRRQREGEGGAVAKKVMRLLAAKLHRRSYISTLILCIKKIFEMACDGNGNQTQFSLVVLLRRLLVRICRALSIVRTIRRHVAVTHIGYLVQFLLFRLFRTQK